MTKTALVTGGTGGLGAATVTAFLSAGWRVVAPARPASVDRVPAGAVAVPADLLDPAGAAAAAATAAAEPRAPLKAVVNLVGGYTGGGLIADTPVEDFEAMFTANLRPTYLTTAAALPHLVAAGGGAVVCVSSRAAVAPFPGAAGYVAAKAAVLAFADTVAAEYRKQHVRCNTVLPGVIDTPANRRAMPDADHRRWVSPAEIAATILFLASDESCPTTAAHIPVYGQS
ncbi:SDR family NAD(P)-dependent oxidoreductase [Actinoplanes teichomyceticus]|uniref:NADP-dependent 3-hydroxy acid dehydrogenase YdfG n=1 Tax=Actinoplanes teichomyceticus TaxID=1867 RepID=A0A561VG39_ACTTI|nr:SDR family NAD(P)-dependent oxidoreductase [Actinoplanes teichomyceticus]TWG10592.1 NADP-dependent 3-hydroxy acid dehydrogenase YdfG [Actinoplanes teichomyceticus]GIF15365.1 glucose 1-dehydrogenase [Actinoplanes teichomyceticus]